MNNAEEITLTPAAPDAGENAKPAEVVVWSEYREQLEKLKTTAETLTVTDASDKAGMKLAKTTRLAIKEIRCAIESRRKELKEEALRKGQKIDAAANELKALCEPLEKRLEEQEKFAEREAARIASENRARRIEEIGKYTNISGQIDYGAMTEEEYQALLKDAKDIFELREKQAREAQEAEAVRLAAETAERERVRLEQEAERKRIAEENARLKKEVEAREAAAKAERDRIEKERAAERAKAEAERRALEEKARIEREKAAEEARKERARIQAEADKAAAEAKRLADIEAARLKKEVEEKKAKALAEKKAAAAPDAEKVRAYAAALIDQPPLSLKSKTAHQRFVIAHGEYIRAMEMIAQDLEGGDI